MAPRKTRKAKRRSLTKGKNFKVASPRKCRGIYEEYVASGLDSLKYYVFQENPDRRNIWNDNMKSSAFFNKYVDSKWFRKLQKDEKKMFMRVFNRFVHEYSNAKDFLWLIADMTLHEIVKAFRKMLDLFGFEATLNEKLDLKFDRERGILEQIVPFETVQDIVNQVASCLIEMKHSTGTSIRRTEFIEPMIIKFMNLYIRCLIGAARKMYSCEVDDGSIFAFETRHKDNFRPPSPTPNLERDELDVAEIAALEVVEAEKLVSINVDLEEEIDKMEVMPIRVAPNHIKWIYDEPSITTESAASNPPQLAPILINSEKKKEEEHIDEMEVMPVRVAPNRLKWVYVETPTTMTSPQLPNISTAIHPEEEDDDEKDLIMKRVGPNRWVWIKPEVSKNLTSSKKREINNNN